MTKTENRDKNRDYYLCSKCLGRLTYKGNKKIDMTHIHNATDEHKCSICGGLLEHEDKLFELINWKINLLSLEFESFIIACQINSNSMTKNEKEIHKITKHKGFNLNRHIKQDIGMMIENKMDKTVDFKHPDVVIMIKIRNKPYESNPYNDVSNVNIFIDANPVFIEGKYRKLVRGIPQTKWPCSHCKGKGCSECNYTGQEYPYTVEGLIAKEVLKLTRGKSTKFHGSGREDIDVLMLGEGRPFVIEVKHPFKRKIDLKFLGVLINSHSDGMIEVNDLEFTNRERKALIKNSSTESYKIYSAIADFSKGVTSQDIENISKLSHIEQRTPQRVEHRRSDKIRNRKIGYINVERINSKKLRLEIKCQGGLYIKELISGDDGRTHPSISEICDNQAVCSQLDVLKVHIPN